MLYISIMEMSLKLEVPFTTDGLKKARAEIDHWIKVLGANEPRAIPPTATATLTPPATINPAADTVGCPPNDFDKMVAGLWYRLTPSVQMLLHAAATYFPSEKQFTIKQLASAMNQPLNTVKAWNRALGKHEPYHGVELFKRVWDRQNFHMIYRVPKDVRDSILRLPTPNEDEQEEQLQVTV